jgi:hypothetical protein
MRSGISAGSDWRIPKPLSSFFQNNCFGEIVKTFVLESKQRIATNMDPE